MAVERRSNSRLARWFDGSWQGASGGSRACRLSDLSVGGCFIHGLAAPQPGERTIVTINFSPAEAMMIAAQVVYIERTIGFSVKFLDMSADDEAQLTRLLDSFKKASA